jgi:hypothetical protein
VAGGSSAKVLLGAERGTLAFSQDWYDDRAEFLDAQELVQRKTTSIPTTPPTRFRKATTSTSRTAPISRTSASGYTIQQGPLLHANTRIHAFGDEQANSY